MDFVSGLVQSLVNVGHRAFLLEHLPGSEKPIEFSFLQLFSSTSKLARGSNFITQALFLKILHNFPNWQCLERLASASGLIKKPHNFSLKFEFFICFGACLYAAGGYALTGGVLVS